jgi:transcriptional regulator with XRE-family HTH domain
MRSGKSQSEIARRLNITRQAVSQLAQTIPERITAALQDASKLDGVQPRYIDSSRGILLGRSKDFQMEAIITLNPETGLRIWYQHNLGQCKICPDRRQCKSMLLRSVEGLGVSLTRQERKLDPSKLSNLVFSRALGQDDTSSASSRS